MFDAYEIIKEENVADINSKGILLKHKKTGAHVALLINDDNNKVFNIAFRTPPKNSTGVAHIIEHTVLCGSQKYPLKDPFVELAKGSLNTFLNAMTYPDKTMYPVASCNDKDFSNLMEVYLDAVFFPNIYKNEKIFKQEGWHYQMESADEPLRYNGVVYNEMKGAFSTADSVLERMVFSALFPDTPYGVESGGDPENIPDLTYEEFLDFHRAYYHPSNSYIYLYGDMDMEEKLDFIDKEYLSKFDKRSIDSEIPYQNPFAKKLVINSEYPILDDEPTEDNTYLNMSMVTGDGLDILTATAFNVLEYVLLDTPGAPLKKALIDAGIGKDVSGCYNDGILQHFFSIEAKYANLSDVDRFEELVNNTLLKIADEGISEKALRAAINYFEFRFREADYATYPKGLMYIMSAYDGWLYDENKPFDYLRELDIYEQLKKNIGTGYYEKLIREGLVYNEHKVILTLAPKRGLAKEKEERLAAKLADIKASMSKEEIDRIVKDTIELREYQNEKDSPKLLDCLPVLSVADIDKKTAVRINTKETDLNGIRFVHNDFDTRGISYLSILFDVDCISNELTPYMSLLKAVLGFVNTKNYEYSDLSNEINARTGGVSFGLQSIATGNNTYKKCFGIKSKYLDPECEFVISMIKEIIFTSFIDDEKRLYEIILNQKSSLQAAIPAMGHISAAGRALSNVSMIDGWQEDISGISYYRFIEKLSLDFENKKKDIIDKLKSLAEMIFRKENLIISVTAGEEGKELLKKHIVKLTDNLSDKKLDKDGYIWTASDSREGIQTSGQVQFVASVGNFADKGYKYKGSLRVFRTMLNYDFLWMNLRVNGGAYGCMSSFKRNGDCYLVSYRDPHLKNTLDVYKRLPKYAGDFDADERTMTKYIIGTVSELDTPMNAKSKGDTSFSSYFAGLTEEDYQKERDEVLSTTPESIRELKDMLEDTLDERHICVLGSEAAIKKHKDIFDHTESFIQG